ncbi:hypothetical protein ACFX13_007864 [Malus domestica]
MSNTLLLHCLILFLILCGGAARGRNISGPQTLPHDAVHHRSNSSTVAYLTLSRPVLAAAEAESSCEETTVHPQRAREPFPDFGVKVLDVLGSNVPSEWSAPVSSEGCFFPSSARFPTPFSFSVNISDFSVWFWAGKYGKKSERKAEDNI